MVMKKWQWWVIVIACGVLMSSVFQAVLPLVREKFVGATLVLLLVLSFFIYGINYAHRHRKEPLSRLEWVILIWFALGMAWNAAQPLSGS